MTVLTNEKNPGEVEQDSAREFNPNIWGTVINTKVENLFREKVKPYFDPRQHCKGCLFALNNKKVTELSNMNSEGVKHIINRINDIEKPLHIEFP